MHCLCLLNSIEYDASAAHLNYTRRHALCTLLTPLHVCTVNDSTNTLQY